STFETSDEDGDDVTVTIDDTTNYQIVGNTVVLTEAGAALVNSGEALPEFTLTPNDGTVNGDTDSATPAVTTVNDAPVVEIIKSADFVEDATNSVEGATVALFTTSDEDGDTVTVTLDDTINYALDGNTVVLTEAGAALVNSGQDLPAYTLTPNDGTVDGEPVSDDPNVTAVDDPTITNIDSVITDEDTAVNINVLANDTDEDSDVSPVASVTNGANGTVSINDDGTVTYTPDANFNGTDSFTYINEEGTEETVNVTINAVNDPTDISVGASDSDIGEVTEDIDVSTTQTLTDSGTLTFSDVDVEDSENFAPTVEFSPENDGDTALGEITIDADGNWTYEVDNSAVQYLGEGESLVEVYTVTLNGTTHDITVTINGADDATTIEPEGTSEALAKVIEDYNVNSEDLLTASGNLEFGDLDDTDRENFEPEISFTSSTSSLGKLGDISLDDNGSWSYSVDNALVQHLDEGEEITETYTVTLNGTVETITILIIGAEDQTEIIVDSSVGDSAEGDVSENSADTSATLTDSGKVTFIDVDDTDRSSFAPTVAFASSTAGANALGSLTIDVDGNWTYEVDNADIAYLDSDESIVETFTVTLNGETQDISVTVNGADTVIAVDDAEAPSTGLTGQYWGYDQSAEGQNTTNLEVVKAYIEANPVADISFISTELDYENTTGVVNQQSGLADNVNDEGVPENLISFLNNDADSIVTINGGSSSTATDAIIDLTGNLYVEEAGVYTIDVVHDDGFELLIDGEAVIGFDAITASIQTSVSLTLAEGLHSIEIIYWDQAGDYELTLNMSLVNGENIWVAENLSHADGASVDTGSSVELDLLSNDIGDGLAINSISDPENGTITIVDGVATYVPDDGYTGIDSFTYDVIDENGNVSNTATGYVTVTHSSPDGIIDSTVDETDSTDNNETDIPVTTVEGENIQGNNRGNTLNGTEGDDTIDGRGGNDTIYGNGGNDDISGGRGNDTIYGGEGNDTIDGGDGSDELYGEAGNDELTAGDNADNLLDGGTGDDTLIGGNNGINTLLGGEGNDTLISGDNRVNTLNGGDGNDSLFGGENASDILIGGAGDDILDGGATGGDILTGGTGSDTFVWDTSDIYDTDAITDFNVAEGDALDLSDLLQDESAGTLSNYFDISFDGNDTTLTISSTENGYDNTTIVLEDTKLEGMNDSTTGNLSDNEVEIVINTLYDEGALIITDDATTDVTSSTASLDDPTL
ncbi:hypothetical protein DS885_15270, partial [Psychromonas sp. B3M02]|uniref:VCBS domain-containing protein n=1 Tax=Psychromonas sp. B3M02 TaxID=2267226 RepID=UPI000DE90A09